MKFATWSVALVFALASPASAADLFAALGPARPAAHGVAYGDPGTGYTVWQQSPEVYQTVTTGNGCAHPSACAGQQASCCGQAAACDSGCGHASCRRCSGFRGLFGLFRVFERRHHCHQAHPACAAQCATCASPEPACDPCEKAEVAHLICLLTSSCDPDTREEAADDLGDFDLCCHPEIVEALRTALLTDGDAEVREEAADSLAELGACTPEARAALQAALNDCDEDVREEAAEALADCPSCQLACPSCEGGPALEPAAPQAPMPEPAEASPTAAGQPSQAEPAEEFWPDVTWRPVATPNRG
ncbi:MAG: HEAT repeat domain-containing protein [Pirellulales bacterium]